MARIFSVGTVARKTAGILLCALVLSLASVAASPWLHKCLHPDADAPGHECAITLFAHGHAAPATVAPIVAVTSAAYGGVPLLAQSFPPAPVDYHFSSSRAPPAGSSLV